MRTSTRTSTRIAGVLAGLALALGGAALTAPAAHADVSACINQVERELKGGEAPETVRAACYGGLIGAEDECVSGLTADGVTKGTAEAACRAAAE
ncbi:hypothetical protein J7F03_31045 [Streptomyces sp. ISL-43]|uniref:hypothetical protein n=1 Tax=Streptomyces sp. ISL-43 TaxID=2819183 RepID=UPI001BE5C4F8|nr:hypothetical protein [Streptomyces sp. ISL-43]MBT2451424.1 hypothetical protein [Streptomyces sp. ISL-43]